MLIIILFVFCRYNGCVVSNRHSTTAMSCTRTGIWIYFQSQRFSHLAKKSDKTWDVILCPWVT
jgi:hypothetical protein